MRVPVQSFEVPFGARCPPWPSQSGPLPFPACVPSSSACAYFPGHGAAGPRETETDVEGVDVGLIGLKITYHFVVGHPHLAHLAVVLCLGNPSLGPF